MKAGLGMLSVLLAAALGACSGGGSNNFGTGDDESGNPGASPSSGAAVWEVQAPVTKIGCQERISPVRQQFQLNGGIINTGIVSLPVSSTADGFSFGFEETNGDCNRRYDAVFSNMTETSANVFFSSISNCGGSVCENQWTGTATLVSE